MKFIFFVVLLSSFSLATAHAEAQPVLENEDFSKTISQESGKQSSLSKNNIIKYGYVSTHPGDSFGDYPYVSVFSWDSINNTIGSVMGEVIDNQRVKIVSEFSILYEIIMPYGETGYIHKGQVDNIVSCQGNNSHLTNCR